MFVVTVAARLLSARMLLSRERAERPCEICGEAFLTRAGARYCGRACKQEAYRRRHEPAGSDNWLRTPTLADLEDWLSFGRQ
jgi:hypothetical protein